MSTDLEEAERRVRAAAVRLAEIGAMRRGSVAVRYVRCSKPNCACRRAEANRHGPYISLTYTVDGKTHSRLLTPAQAEVARRQIRAGREFREHVRALWIACETWADAELDEAVGEEPSSGQRPARRRSPASVAPD